MSGFWVIPATMALNVILYVLLGNKLSLLPWWLFVAAFFTVNLLDVHSTVIAIRKFSIECEKNPLFKWIIKRFGWRSAAILKLIFPISILFFLDLDLPENKAAVASLTILFAIVVASNYFQFFYFPAETVESADKKEPSSNQNSETI